MKTKLLTALVVVVAILTLAALIAAVIIKDSNPSGFTPPPFDSNAQQGVPNVTDEKLAYGTVDIPLPSGVSLPYHVRLCLAPAVEDGKIVAYLTNPKNNDNVWLKLKVLDAEGNKIAETGVIKPGEYVQYAPLLEGVDAASLTDGTQIKLKVLAYEPETYSSVGSFPMLNVYIGGIAPEASEQPE